MGKELCVQIFELGPYFGVILVTAGRKKLFTARPGPIFRLGAKVSWLVLLQKVQSKYRYGGWYQYCTVEIPTEMEFTGTFQKYLQCVNRM